MEHFLMFIFNIFTAIGACLGCDVKITKPGGEEVVVNDIMVQSISVSPIEVISVVCGLLIPFAALVVIVYLILSHLRKISRIRAQIIETALREGRDLPDAFFLTHKRDPFYGGMLWIAWSVGFAILFLFWKSYSAVGLCSIGLFIGIAKIISYMRFRRISENRRRDSSSNDYQQN